ncbi:MAG TPA: hypothetical protein EYG01_00035, partial [Flavobacteriales bacterium]|nr:hypothetical protein [Flavobacteriales bacterium]
VNNSTASTDNVGAHCDSYTWVDGVAYTASNNTATWITTNAAGCDNVATLNLTVNNSTTSTDPQTACNSYTWLDGNTYTTSNNTATWTTTNAAGCDNVATLNLTIESITLSATVNNIDCYEYSTGTIDLIVIGGTPPYTYQWSNGESTQNIVDLPVGNYTVVVYDMNNCLGSNTFSVLQPDSIYIALISTPDTCERGLGMVSINTYGGQSPYTYLWSSGHDTSCVSNLYEGIVEVVIIDANQCKVTKTITINNIKSPEADFNTFPEHRRYYDQLDKPFFFIDISNAYWQDILSWNWDFDYDGISPIYDANDSIVKNSYYETGLYRVFLSIETEYHCIDTISKHVLIDEYALYIPNAFTPLTGDGLNDEFKPYGYGVVNYTMQIYNRWGEVVFESDDINRGWNGTTRDGGNIASIGVYLYYIAVEDIYGEIFKYEGKLDLLR